MKSRLLTLLFLLSILSVTGGEVDQALVDSAVEKMKSRGVRLAPIAKNTPHLLRLDGNKRFDDDALAELKPVAKHILWLDLAGSDVTNKGLATLSSFKNLTRLNLEKTGVSDSGIDSISGLQKLEYLSLYRTVITDQSLEKIASNKNLEKLFIWQTRTTDQGVATLAKALPDLDINTGWKTSTSSKVSAPEKVVSDNSGSFDSALVELSAAVEKAKSQTEAAKGAHARALRKAAEANQYAETLKLEVEQTAAVENKAVRALEQLKQAIQVGADK